LWHIAPTCERKKKLNFQLTNKRLANGAEMWQVLDFMAGFIMLYLK